jgi:hypothetical protein
VGVGFGCELVVVDISCPHAVSSMHNDKNSISESRKERRRENIEL